MESWQSSTLVLENSAEVYAWATGEATPSGSSLTRLDGAAEVLALLGSLDSHTVIQAWFQGMNPELDDRSPAMALREGGLAEVLAAARGFAANG